MSRAFKLVNSSASTFAHITHYFQKIPVKDIVIGEALPVEEIAEKLSKKGVVGFLVES